MIGLFIIAIFPFLLSVYLKAKSNEKYALWLLALGAFILRLYVAHLDPFLNDWDERYHALVARNLMDNPLKPYLKQPLLPHDYTDWGGNYIWVHKQPLFMWQMALSMKLFGVSEFAIRYPDVLMGTIMVFVIYQITVLLTENKNTAYAAALFMALSNYQLDLISGHKGMDHDDVAFGFYVLLSFWAYARYIQKPSIGFAALIGIFAGCAILNKWLTGLLVFGSWGVNILIHIHKKETRTELGHLLLALICCTIIFLPWQLYILHTYPVEARYEYAYNERHISEALEGHHGNASYYLRNFDLYFGFGFPLVFLGLIAIFLNKSYNRKLTTAITIAFIAVFIFFTFIVHTKVDSYFFVVVPLGFILMAVSISWLSSKTKKEYIIQFILTSITAFFVLNCFQIFEAHSRADEGSEAHAFNTYIYKGLKKVIPAGTTVVINVKGGEDLACDFYNKGITSYGWCISESQLDTLLKRNQKIAYFQERYGYGVPDYIKNNPVLYQIKIPLK